MPVHHPSFNYAELVQGHRWYIKYYQTNPQTQVKERFRETFNLNRIRDLEERKKAAKRYINEINAKLPIGWPFEDVYNKIPTYTNIVDAVSVAKDKISTSDRDNTNRNFRSMVNIFNDFLEHEKLKDLAIGDFKKSHAVAFLDYAVFDREVSNRTYNNYLERLQKLWKELKKRDYVKKNYWAKFERKKPGPKRRRAFNDHEKDLVANYAADKDRWLTLGILLQYYCFIRPVELRRLRFDMFDLKNGLIYLTGEETKNRENAIVTIPDTLLKHIVKLDFKQWPQNWLLFGAGGQPHATKSCSHDLMNSRHRKLLLQLNDEGKLSNIKGLSFYSWKDTGALELFKRKVNLLEIMAQLRHKDLATTQRYCKSLYAVNFEIKHLDNVLLK